METKEIITDVVLLGGWFLAILQFILSHRENRIKNEAELFEKTLSYFEKDSQGRELGISMVEGIWLKRKQNVAIIVPVLINQLDYLLSEAKNSSQEERNTRRLLFLLIKCLPFSDDSHTDRIEIIETIMAAARAAARKENTILDEHTLRRWYMKFKFEEDKIEDYDEEMEEIKQIENKENQNS